MNIHFSLTNRPSSSSQVNVQRGMYNSMLHHQKRMLAALHNEKMKRQEVEHQKELISKREHELELELSRQKELAHQNDVTLQPVMNHQQQAHNNVVLHSNTQPVNSSDVKTNVNKNNKFNSLLSKMNQQKRDNNLNA